MWTTTTTRRRRLLLMSLLLMLLLLHHHTVTAEESWGHEIRLVNPSSSIFYPEKSNEDAMNSAAKLPDTIGSKTGIGIGIDGLISTSQLAYSEVHLHSSTGDTDSTFSFTQISEDHETDNYLDDQIKFIKKRSVEGNRIDESLDGKINMDSLLENDLEAPATAVSNRIDSTNIRRDLANGEFYEKIQPTKSDSEGQPKNLFSKTREEQDHEENSGEGGRASARGHARALPLPKPHPHSASDQGTQSPSPDIHDFITGFVKLLKGNPNGHVGVGGRPLYPTRTRINNRGPPRITDDDPSPPLPPRPLPVPDNPSHPVNNIKIPPPYPFDIPPPISSLPPQPASILRPFVSGIPLPEQIVPKDPNIIETTSKGDLGISIENYNKSTIAPSKTKYNPIGNDSHKTKQPFLNNTELIKESSKKPGPYKQPSNSYIQPSEITLTSIASRQPVHSVNSTVGPNITTATIVSGHKQQNNSQKVIPGQQVTLGTFSADQITPFAVNDNQTESSEKIDLTTEKTNQNKISSSTATTTTKVTTTITTTTTTTEHPKSSLARPRPPVSILESSMGEGERHRPSTSTTKTTPLQSETSLKYYPRPGIVLDDLEYKPGGLGMGGGSLAYRPIVTAPPPHKSTGQVFDVTVSAIQGAGSSNTGRPFVYPVDIEGVQVGSGSGEVSVITTAEAGQHYVSIDGKRTYINLFNSSPLPDGPIAPASDRPPPSYNVGQVSGDLPPPPHTSNRPLVYARPTPPVRIDTCIVGDDSTCDKTQNERCRTEVGVSSCHCRPGYSRRKELHREPCKRAVSMVVSVRVDRMYDQRVSWSELLADRNSPQYQQIEYEAERAIKSAMEMTPFSDEYLSCRINSVYPVAHGGGGGGVFVNVTLQLEESAELTRPAVNKEIQRHLIGVIHRRGNNIGSSALWVDSPAGAVSQLTDLDECEHTDLHDCHLVATCSNIFGSFGCACPDGYRDPWAGNSQLSGRECHTCLADHCNHRGECRYHNDQPVCKCASSYYGAQCEIDGEVLGVAVGASVAAILIILSTLVCLCMWSRRWSREQKVAAGMGSPVFGYNTVKTPAMGVGGGMSPYQVALEDRLRWAQIADVMAHATNHYAPEPGAGAGMSRGFGGTLPHLSAAPVPMPRLSLRPASVHGTRAGITANDSSCSEEEDRTDLLGRNFHVPRPKSRSSVANQSGIYYDVDYEQQPIPMNTYTLSNRSNYYRT